MIIYENTIELEEVWYFTNGRAVISSFTELPVEIEF